MNEQQKDKDAEISKALEEYKVEESKPGHAFRQNMQVNNIGIPPKKRRRRKRPGLDTAMDSAMIQMPPEQPHLQTAEPSMGR